MNTNAGFYKKAAARIAEVIAQHHGIESEQIAEVAGYSLLYTKHALSIVSANGIAFPVHTEKCRRGWFPAEIAKPMLAAQKQAIAERRAAVEAARAKKQPTRREVILRMAEDEEGISTKRVRDELSYPANTLRKHCSVLVSAGKLFKAERVGCYARWFAKEDRAKAWAAMPAMFPSEVTAERQERWNKRRRQLAGKAAARAQERAEARLRKQEAEFAARQAARQAARAKAEKRAQEKAEAEAKKPKVTRKPSQPAPVVIRQAVQSQEVDYSRAKITICPAPKFNYRHEYAPGSEAWTGFVREWKQLRGASA